MNKLTFEKEIKKEIVSRITKNFKVKDIILFGSYAYGEPNEDSDIDLIVVLDKKGFSKSFTEQMQNNIEVSKTIYDIERKTPIDLLVYTIDEWNKLLKLDGYITREINRLGVRLV